MAARKSSAAPKVSSIRPTRIIALANNKGGVGKTTTALNLAGALVLKERKVLVIDLDPQCNASIAFNIIVDARSPGVRHLLMNDRHSVSECIYDRGPFCDFIPADPDLAELQTQLLVDPKGRVRLREHLQRLTGKYDFVLLDCPPDMGVLTQSALVAAHEVIIPVDVGFFSVAGLARIVRIIEDVRNTYNPELKISGVLATKYDPRTTLSETTVSEIQAQGLPIFQTKVRISVDIIRSQMARVPVSIYAQESHGAIDYNSLAEELLPAKVIPLRQRRKKTAEA
jgi:chromosome partitioning protein